MNEPTKHCVITENYICWLDDGQAAWHMCPILNAAHALEVAQVWGFTHMWIMPGSYCDRQGWKFFESSSLTNPAVSYFPERRPSRGDELPAFERVNTGPDTPTVMIGYPRTFGLKVETARDILDAVSLLEGI